MEKIFPAQLAFVLSSLFVTAQPARAQGTTLISQRREKDHETSPRPEGPQCTSRRDAPLVLIKYG